MTEIAKPSITLFVLSALFLQCGGGRENSVSTVRRDAPAQGETSKEECDFSKFSPMKAHTNFGSPMISFPKPEYPPAARDRGIQGSVAVRLLVDVRTGLVKRACIIEGDEVLAPAAKDAAMRVKFSPYSEDIQAKFAFAEELVTYGFVEP